MVSEAVLQQRRDSPAPTAPAKWRMFGLLLLPLIFLALYGPFVQARGPFYLGFNSDPDYAYLCNSLNIATGHAPWHVDHPGTALQILGSVVIRAAHPWARKAERIDAVLRHPEEHLQWINSVLAGIYTVSLVVVGVGVWRRTGNWYPALFLQCSPILLGDQFHVVTRVSAEPMLLIVGPLMAALLFLDAREERSRHSTICGLGFLAALGTVTKLSFLPFVLTPLPYLRSWKQRGAYFLYLSTFAFMWLLRLGGNKSRLLEWAHGLALRQGRYGRGEPGVVPPDYIRNLLQLVTDNPWLSLVVAVSFATFVYGWTRWKHETEQSRRRVLLLSGLVGGEVLQMAMVAKYAEWRYLLPALMFCPLNLLLLFQFWAAQLPVIRRLLSTAIVMIALGAAIGLHRHYVQYAKKCAGRMEIARALQTRFKDAPIASYYGASTPAHALWFGNLWSGNRYTKPLAKILESDTPAYWILPSGGVFFMGQKVANLQDFGRYQSSFILVGWIRSAPRILALLPPNARTEKLLERSGEVITRVTLD